MKLEFKEENAAFCADEADDEIAQDDAARAECARILRRIADRLESGHDAGLCMDYNGNRVGEWSR